MDYLLIDVAQVYGDAMIRELALKTTLGMACIYIIILPDAWINWILALWLWIAGVDPGFEGGGAVASEARSQDFFGQFWGLFKEFGAKRGGRAPPSGASPELGQKPGFILQVGIPTGWPGLIASQLR